MKYKEFYLSDYSNSNSNCKNKIDEVVVSLEKTYASVKDFLEKSDSKLKSEAVDLIRQNINLHLEMLKNKENSLKVFLDQVLVSNNKVIAAFNGSEYVSEEKLEEIGYEISKIKNRIEFMKQQSEQNNFEDLNEALKNIGYSRLNLLENQLKDIMKTIMLIDSTDRMMSSTIIGK